MRTKKIRGHRRRWKHIDHWIAANMHLDLDYLKARKRDYVKIHLHPWGSISFTNSQTPEPTGETKAKILHGLIEIHDAWKQELDKLEESYYLKIWLYEPRFSNSQMVCAIGDCLDFYEIAFFKPENAKEFKPDNYGRLKKDVSLFNWEYRLDEEHVNNSEVGSPEMYETIKDYESEKRWFKQLLKKPHRTMKYKEQIGDATESYSFKKGDVWLGGK